MQQLRVGDAAGGSVRLAVGVEPADALFGALLGEPVVVRHQCPACGSDGHGRPWLTTASGRSAGAVGAVSVSNGGATGSPRHRRARTRCSSSSPAVSVAHAGELTLVGVLDGAGRLGIDLERADAVAPVGVRNPSDPGELSDLELWVAKEAFLKATCDGLRRDPASVAVGGAGRHGFVDLPGHVAAWYVLAP